MKIYLDHNATTPIDSRVVDAMTDTLRLGLANPASQHAAGRTARRIVEEAREKITSHLGGKTTGMDADQLIFTSGGTEANNLALRGLAAQRPGCIVISPFEHPSVRGAAEELARQGREVRVLPARADGTIDLNAAEEMITREVALVSVMLANNETGVIQPLAEIARLCRQREVLLHTDAVQAVGKLAVDFRRLDVAALTIAPHKFHGPLGTGGLLLRSGVTLQPQLWGGFQQAGLRPGTESPALAVGFQKAVVIALQELPERANKLRELRDRFESFLIAGEPNARIIGADSPRLPQTTNISFPQVDRQALVMALDLAGVACSTGSACASGSSELSPTLLAMGISPTEAATAIRLSWGAFTTAEEMTTAAERILLTVERLRREKPY